MKICPKCNIEHKKKGVFCSKTCANRSKKSWNKGLTKETDNRIPQCWNKGLTKETDSRLLKQAQTLSNTVLGHPGCKHTEETKARLSLVAKDRKLGGYVRNSGRGKKGWFKGFFCDSSYELAYIIYCLDHNIDIRRNTEKRQYIWNGKELNYIPDFIVNGKIIEIKGFKTEQWDAKLAFNPDITVLYKDDLTNVFSYVKDKYGNDFVKLYETN